MPFVNIRLVKEVIADDPARPLVRDAEDDAATAFIGQRDTVVDELLKVVVATRFLELQTFALGLSEPRRQIRQ